MSEPDFKTELVDDAYFSEHPEFAKKVVKEYREQKELNASWYNPKVPFYIRMPKLIDNYHKAKLYHEPTKF